MKEVFNSILDTIGNTPIVKLNHVVPKSPHTFWAKMESFNPGLSVKDRLAMALVEDAEKRGALKPGGTIVEATSGNTGMGLAMVAAVKGYKAVFTMPEKISEEKRAILRAYGARVVITPTGVEPDDPRSHYSVAKKIAEITPNSFLANQYHNPANAEIHYRVTGPEIWRQMEGKIDVFVGGAGTGGTISGVGRYLKEQNPDVKIMCADPVGSILFDLFYYKEIREPAASYKVEGVGEDMLPDNVQFQYMDDFVRFTDQEAFTKTRELTFKEGICVGPSSGGALAAAIKYSEKLKKPSHILVMMPDNGRAYLSKTFNLQWLVENGMMPSQLEQNHVADLLKHACVEWPRLDVKVEVGEVLQQSRAAKISEYLVYSDSTLVGYLDIANLLGELAQQKIHPTEPILYAVQGPLPVVEASTRLSELEKIFRTSRFAVEKASQKVLSQLDLMDFLGR